MNVYILEAGTRADALPRPDDVGHAHGRLGSRNFPRIAGLARQDLEDDDRRR